MLKYIIFLHIGHILGFVYLRIYAAVRNYTTGFFLGTPRSCLRGIFAHKIGTRAHFINTHLCLIYYILWMHYACVLIFMWCASVSVYLCLWQKTHFMENAHQDLEVYLEPEWLIFAFRARVVHLCLEPEWPIYA